MRTNPYSLALRYSAVRDGHRSGYCAHPTARHVHERVSRLQTSSFLLILPLSTAAQTYNPNQVTASFDRPRHRDQLFSHTTEENAIGNHTCVLVNVVRGDWRATENALSNVAVV